MTFQRSQRGEGIGRLILPGQPVVEHRTVKCGHMGETIFIPIPTRASDMPPECGNCNKPLCVKCEEIRFRSGGTYCKPFEDTLAEQEERARNGAR